MKPETQIRIDNTTNTALTVPLKPSIGTNTPKLGIYPCSKRGKEQQIRIATLQRHNCIVQFIRNANTSPNQGLAPAISITSPKARDGWVVNSKLTEKQRKELPSHPREMKWFRRHGSPRHSISSTNQHTRSKFLPKDIPKPKSGVETV